VLFGLHRAEGPPEMIFALYGEPIDLLVPRDQYGLSALFMTKPTNFDVKPLLLAVGTTHEVLAAAKLQTVTVHGEQPSHDTIRRLLAQTPAQPLPFRLPAAEAIEIRPPVKAIETGRPVEATEIRPPVKAIETRRPVEATEIRPRAAATERVFPSNRILPPAAAAKRLVQQRPFDDFLDDWEQPSRHLLAETCKARVKSGERCPNAQSSSTSSLCNEHELKVIRGKTVRWYESGEQVRPGDVLNEHRWRRR
jgi:hypothetical protein